MQQLLKLLFLVSLGFYKYEIYSSRTFQYARDKRKFMKLHIRHLLKYIKLVNWRNGKIKLFALQNNLIFNYLQKSIFGPKFK